MIGTCLPTGFQRIRPNSSISSLSVYSTLLTYVDLHSITLSTHLFGHKVPHVAEPHLLSSVLQGMFNIYPPPMLRACNVFMLSDALSTNGTMLLLDERFLRFLRGLEFYSMVQDTGTHGSTHLNDFAKAASNTRSPW